MHECLASVSTSPVFTKTAAPYLLLDNDLTIQAANDAYLTATAAGIISARQDISYDDAVDWLRGYAFAENRPIQDVASDIIQRKRGID